MIGNKIMQLRKENNLTQQDLANILNISRSTISLYEINRNVPDIGTLIKIADFFNVSLDFLAGRTPIKYLPKKEWIDNIPIGTFDIINDPKINEALKDFGHLSNNDKDAIITYLYGLKYKDKDK